MDPYVSIKDYLTDKSFKMSDAYSVEVYDLEPAWNDNFNDEFGNVKTDNDADKYFGIEVGKTDSGYKTRLFHFKNCTGFTPPVYKPKEEKIEFCNRTQIVYLPNTDKPEPLTLKFHETEDQYVARFIKYCLRKNFLDEVTDFHRDSYRPYRYIDWIKVHIWNNDLTKKVMTHIFKSCRISTYDYDYNLDYSSSQAIQPSIAFSFLEYRIDLNPVNDKKEKANDG